MKIEITRSGGFGGITRSWSLEVSATEAEQRWLPLARAEGGIDHADAPRGTREQRDRFTYRIAIGYTEVYVFEGRPDGPWRELIDRARSATAAPSTPSAATPPAAAPPPAPSPADHHRTTGDATPEEAAPEEARDAGPGKPRELL
ncbi:hypothetical protein RCH21_000923 [Arthrobacter sp. PL16]|uniref:protealysin inhibitor emfourin n=1 Tax=Arthrobacter sp. PL16 TaxID=3071720 RepID=UPI002DFD7043|nr:hypothetical protein [Arthrobacter sp. PL16]